MLIGQGRQLAGPLIHRLLALRFHHHPQHGLGAAGANQDAAALSHADFSGMHRVGEGRTVSPALATGPIGNGDVHQLLGIGLETAIHPAIQMDALAVAEGRELKCGEHSIAAEAMGGCKDVTGLFTTEGRTAILDSAPIRASAEQHRVFYTTTLAAAEAVCMALEQEADMTVRRLQDLHESITG